MDFPRQTPFQSSCCSGSLTEVSCAPSSALGYSPKLHQTSPMDEKEHRRNTRFYCSQQQSAAKQLRATYPEVAHPPHTSKRELPLGKETVFSGFFFFLLLSSIFLTDPNTLAKATPMTSAHLSVFFLTWGSGQRSQRLLSSIKPLADKQGES